MLAWKSEGLIAWSLEKDLHKHRDFPGRDNRLRIQFLPVTGDRLQCRGLRPSPRLSIPPVIHFCSPSRAIGCLLSCILPHSLFASFCTHELLNMNSDFTRLPAQNCSTSITPQEDRSRPYTETWSSTSSSDRDERTRWWRKQRKNMRGRWVDRPVKYYLKMILYLLYCSKRSTSSNRQATSPTKMASATSNSIEVESRNKYPSDCWEAQSDDCNYHI